MVRRWRRQREELIQPGRRLKLVEVIKEDGLNLKNVLEEWVNIQRADRRGVSTVEIRIKAKTIATEKILEDFKGGPSWCLRFMR